jgi:molybdopterin synthase sulfur carrier subunit
MARILYFAGLAEAVGQTSEDIALPAEVVDVGGLLAWLRSRGPQFEQALAQAKLRVTVNRQIANPGARVTNSDEIALIGLPR